jgi:Arc/MetJ-type ribon-helix-helix transcriptional regulator
MSDERLISPVDLRVRVPASLDRALQEVAGQRLYRSKAEFVRDLCRREIAASIKASAAEVVR